MRAIGEADFQEISIVILKNFIRPLEFDVYVQRTINVFTKIFRAGDPLDWERVNLYKRKGIKYFFVKRDEYNKYTQLVDNLGELLTNSVGKFTRDQSLIILKELSRYVMHEIIENNDVSPRTVSNAGVVVNGCIENLSKDPKSVVKMLQLMSNQPYILKHSTTVSIFAIILAQGLGIHDKKRLKNIGWGAFLHDIGVGQLTFDPEDTEH